MEQERILLFDILYGLVRNFDITLRVYINISLPAYVLYTDKVEVLVLIIHKGLHITITKIAEFYIVTLMKILKSICMPFRRTYNT